MTIRFAVILEFEPGRAYAGSREACEAFAAAAKNQVMTVRVYDGKGFEVGRVIGATIHQIT